MVVVYFGFVKIKILIVKVSVLNVVLMICCFGLLLIFEIINGIIFYIIVGINVIIMFIFIFFNFFVYGLYFFFYEIIFIFVIIC